MAKKTQATWFKLFSNYKPLMDTLPSEALGNAMKAVMAYFVDGKQPELSPLEMTVFVSLVPHVDEAREDYKARSELGKRGGRPKKETPSEENPEKPKETDGFEEKGAETEAEAEIEAEAEAEAEESVCQALAPSKHTHTKVPTLQEVESYVTKHGYRFDPQRFVDYYNSIGWRIGKQPMRDWKAAARNWHRKEEKEHGKTEADPSWTVGVWV